MGFIADIFGLSKPKMPPAPPPLPPLPVRKDPEIEAARKRQLTADKLRRGRRASILTSGRGVLEELGTIDRPEAGAIKLGE